MRSSCFDTRVRVDPKCFLLRTPSGFSDYQERRARWLREFSVFSSTVGGVSVEFLIRVGVYLSTGEEILSRVDASARELILSESYKSELVV